jgi:hypothetical protein
MSSLTYRLLSFSPTNVCHFPIVDDQMKSHYSPPELTITKHHSQYVADLRFTSTESPPLRHSSKPRDPVYWDFAAPASHYQVDSVPLTVRHQNDFEISQSKEVVCNSELLDAFLDGRDV